MSSDALAVFRRKHCGFVFQQIYLIDKMNLLDNVITAGSLTGKNKADIVRRANALFDMVNISETTRRKLPCGDCDLGAYKESDSARTEKLETFLKDMGW